MQESTEGASGVESLPGWGGRRSCTGNHECPLVRPAECSDARLGGPEEAFGEVGGGREST